MVICTMFSIDMSEKRPLAGRDDETGGPGEDERVSNSRAFALKGNRDDL